MMSGAKKRVPKRRFKEFLNAGDWEQCKLGDIVDFLDGQRKPLKESDRIKGKYPYYGASGIIDYINDYLFDENLVLLSEDGANIIDRNYPVCFIATGKYWVNNHAHVLKAKAGVIDKFICESLERLDYTKFNTGTAQPKLNQDICQKIVITIPNEDEQKCISEFLYRINNIITLHQRKLDKLQATKKALLQEMFPEEGQDKPKRRFKGFTDAWEQRKLSEVTTCFDNLRVPVTASDRVPGKIPYYGANGIQDYVSGHTHSGEFVLIAEDGANDLNDYPIQYVNGAIWVNNHAHVIAGYKEKLENKFLSYSLKTVKMTTFIVGGGRSKLNLKALLEIPISMPNYDEQCVIGKFIETIDKNITLHQRKLDKLKNLKQAYLNEMFV